MNMLVEPLQPLPAADEKPSATLLQTLLQAPQSLDEPGDEHRHIPANCAELGELLALDTATQQAWVRIPALLGQRAVLARSTVDLHGAHIGREVLLNFIAGDAHRPVVVGVLAGAIAWPEAELPDQVRVDADGQRMLVTAKEQLVLRCGKASITLTKAGKVVIEGSYLLSRSTGTNRIKGGSVQLN
jgi:Domain of unknown function (DUF6484)